MKADPSNIMALKGGTNPGIRYLRTETSLLMLQDVMQ